MRSTQHCLSQALCTFWTPKTIPKPRNTAPFTSQRPSAKLDQHYPRPCFVLLVHCPRAACADACGATMCSTQPCLPRAFCTFWTPKTTSAPQHRSIHLPTCLREAWSSTTPTLFLLLRCPRAACNDACDACGLPSCCPPFSLASSPCASRLAPLHLPSPATPPMRLRSRSPPSSLPSPVPTHAPPVSLPSIFPPQPHPHPCASSLAPLSPPSSLPSPVPTDAPPVSLPSIFPPQPVPIHAPPVSSPRSSLPNPVPTNAPPASLPSIFPPQPRPHPCASRLAPLHLPFQPRPHPCASRLAPLHLPVPTCPSRLAPLHLLKMGGSETGGAWVGEGRRKGVGGAHGCGRGWGGKMEGSETVWLGCGRGWGVHGCGRLRG